MPMKRLTARSVETVRATDKRLELRDELVRGLELRVTMSGIKSWSLLYTDKRTGKKRRFGLGTYPAVSLEEARTRAKEEAAVVARGGDPAKGVTDRRDALTFAELAEQKLTSMEPRRGERPRRSIRNYRSMLDLHINPVSGDLKATEVRKIDIRELLTDLCNVEDARFKAPAERLARKKRNPTILDRGRIVSHLPNRVFELIRSVFRWGIGEDLVEHDPTIGLKRPLDVETARDRNLSEQEIPAFWKAIQSASIDPGIRAALLLEVVTGQRIGEIIERKQADLEYNSEGCVLVLPRLGTKNKKQNHRVPLSPLAKSLIDEAIARNPESDFIFASPVTGRSLTPESTTRAIGRLRPTLEASDIRGHDLRRTASNGMRRIGIPKFIVSVTLNHVSARSGDVTSEHYLDEWAFEAEKKDALLRWGRKLESILRAANVEPVASNVTAHEFSAESSGS